MVSCTARNKRRPWYPGGRTGGVSCASRFRMAVTLRPEAPQQRQAEPAAGRLLCWHVHTCVAGRGTKGTLSSFTHTLQKVQITH